MKNIKLLFLAVVAVLVIQACSPSEGNFTGSEYMPDMGHPVSLEANTYNYYYHNTWDEESTIKLADLAYMSKLPVNGTIPRGYAGGQMSEDEGNLNAFRYTQNGSVPYYYEDNDSARLDATALILDNPYPITAEGLAQGKELYDIYCGICHGETGDGQGYLYNSDDNPNAKYLLAPAILTNEEFSAASNGRYYHAIMYGKNVMGAYADKLNFEERWQVIHHIRALQAKAADAEYSAETNTFNPAFGMTEAEMIDDLAGHAVEDMEEESPTADGHSAPHDHSDGEEGH